MINFEEELKNFKPILEINDIEENIVNEEILDAIDIIKEIMKNDTPSTNISNTDNTDDTHNNNNINSFYTEDYNKSNNSSKANSNDFNVSSVNYNNNNSDSDTPANNSFRIKGKQGGNIINNNYIKN